MRAWQVAPTFSASSAPPAGLSAAGGRIEVPGLPDPALAVGLDLLVPGDVQPVPGAAAGSELSGFDPVVDDAGAAAEPAGGFGDADLAAVGRGERGRGERAGAGGPAQVGGLGDPGAAAGLGLGVPGDAEPAGRAAAGGQLPGVDPVVDDAGAAAQPPGGLGHGDLAGAAGIRDRDLVGVADPLDRVDVEFPAVAGAVSGGIQPGGQLVVAGSRPELSGELDGGGRVRRAVPGWTGLSMVSSSVAPVCQRIPIRALPRSGSGSTVTSAIRVRSSRLRSLALVVGAFHRPGRSAASFSRSSRLGSGGSVSWAACSACSAWARAASLASQRASRERATSRFSGSTAQNARSARSAS